MKPTGRQPAIPVHRSDLLSSETFPSTVPTPALPRSAFSPISGPCVMSPKGSGTKTGAPSISLSVSMTNLLLHFLPTTVPQGSVTASVKSTHAAGSSNRPSLSRTAASAYPSCPMNARPRRLDAPGTRPSWEELLGER